MYALVSNGTLVKYPVSLMQWRSENPFISLPSAPTEAQLNEQGLYSVELSPSPAYDHTVNVTASAKLGSNGKWRQEWKTSPASAAEIEQRTLDKAATIRKERNEKLTATDWTQLPDAPVNATAWSNYRQALRDITLQPGFPWHLDWPVEPA